MDIKQTKRTLLNSYMAAYKGLAPRKSWLLESRHGMGKSQVIAQLAGEISVKLDRPFGFVDIRLGQYEIGDLIGLQRICESYTITEKVFKGGVIADEKVLAKDIAVHDLPLWFPRNPDWCGFIFFDEINRGSRDTQQWSFQAVLDYRVNFVDFPKGCMIIAACNDDQDVYSVLNLDAALYDRFGIIKFQPSIPEWLSHAESCGVHDAVLTYIRKFGNDSLDPPSKIEPGKIYPSRRSWFSLSDEMKGFAGVGDDPMLDMDYLFMLSKSWVGEAVAVNFTEYIKKDYKVYTPEEILNNFPRHQDKFKTMPSTDITFYNKELVRYINKVKLTKKQKDNLYLYYTTIPKESASGFWSEFSTTCRKQATDWYHETEAGKYTRDFMNFEASTK